MKHGAQWSLLFALCVFATQGQAQRSGCDGGRTCISTPPVAAVAGTDAGSAAAELSNLAHVEQCPDGPVEVTAASREERSFACSAVNDAVQLLRRCEIPLRRTLHLQIMNEVRHPFSREPIFGFFDTRHERVLVTREAAIASLAAGTPYVELPERDLYRSLIVHEVVHGIMHQNLNQPAASHAVYEYPAYALQVASLPPDVRDKLLKAIPNRATPGRLIFTDAILFFDPYFFAVNAYEHFNSAADGCAHLHILLNGEAPFAPIIPSN